MYSAGSSHWGRQPDNEEHEIECDTDGSDAPLARRSCHSHPETDTWATQKTLLGELIRLGPYQSDPDDRAFAARNERIRGSITANEMDESAPYGIPRYEEVARS